MPERSQLGNLSPPPIVYISWHINSSRDIATTIQEQVQICNSFHRPLTSHHRSSLLAYSSSFHSSIHFSAFTMPSEYQIHGRTQFPWTSIDALQNLRLNTNVPKPTDIPKGHVLVRIRAAALNARDMMGKFPTYQKHTFIRPTTDSAPLQSLPTIPYTRVLTHPTSSPVPTAPEKSMPLAKTVSGKSGPVLSSTRRAGCSGRTAARKRSLIMRVLRGREVVMFRAR